MTKKPVQKQEKSLNKLNDLFPLPNPSSGDIKKTFEEMGRTLPEEKGEKKKAPQSSTGASREKISLNL